MHCHAGCRFSDILAAAGISGAEWLGLDGSERWSRKPAIRTITIRRKREADPRISVAAERWADEGRHKLRHLARQLGVEETALAGLGVGFAPAAEVAHFQRSTTHYWSFPLRDSTGSVVGCRLRSTLDGSKCSIRGGHEGCFFAPAILASNPEVLFIAEGASDACALAGLGFSTIGRPSATGGRGLVCELVRNLHPREVVIVADRDKAGLEGAEALAAEMVLLAGVRVVCPPEPCKDARDWVRRGATRDDVIALVDKAAVRTLTFGEGGAGHE